MGELRVLSILPGRCYNCHRNTELYLLSGTTIWKGKSVSYQLRYDPRCRDVQDIELGEVSIRQNILNPEFAPATIARIIKNNIRLDVCGYDPSQLDVDLISSRV